MKRILFIFTALLIFSLSGLSQNVSIKTTNESAALVFRNLMEQTGKNFVYSSDLLKDLRVSINVTNQPLIKVLDEIFKDTDISYRIKGKNVILKREKKKKKNKLSKSSFNSKITEKTDTIIPTLLREVVIESLPVPSNVETAEIGFSRITAEEINKTPVIFGESDIIRTLHTQAGISSGMEGMADMYVDGGNPDENLYLLDNIPFYQVNHFGGLFSPFNTDLISNADFYKTSVPAKFDGRLSSFMDVGLKKASSHGHHGSARLGLTSGAFNISGPIGSKTTYLFGIRRSWYDVLTIPLFAILNSKNKEQKTDVHYFFTDLNAKIIHNFSQNISGYVSTYYGNDLLKTKFKNVGTYYDLREHCDETNLNFNWGNLMIQTGINYQIHPNLNSEFTLAYINYFTNLQTRVIDKEQIADEIFENETSVKSHNFIRDIIVKGDFEWKPQYDFKSYFGAGYTFHSFLPNKFHKETRFNESISKKYFSSNSIPVNEAYIYFDTDWKISEKIRMDIGLNGSLFKIEHKTNGSLSPRLSISYRPTQNFAFKAAYSHTVQYIQRLTHSYLSLPTDQWVPISGDFKPESADKYAVGGYWKSTTGFYEISLEGYFKKMNNLLDYKEEYYLLPPFEMWTSQLTSGSGRAKGLELKFEKKAGKVTGHISYTLAWSDRLFKEKNGGKRFPSRFDNRHTVNVLINWEINPKVSLNAAWVGHSGNHYTFLSQSFLGPEFSPYYNMRNDGIPLKSDINGYQFPFYHRLDLSCSVRNKRGYWNFSLYNAYCHMNVVAIERDFENKPFITPGEWGNNIYPVFKRLKLFPVIPSVSYTWQF